MIQGGVSTQNAKVAESIALIRQEWRRMAEEGPTAEELEKAKVYLTGSFPLRLARSGQLSGMLIGMQTWNLGIDYMERRNKLIDAITLEDAKRAAKKYWREEDLTIVVVGLPEDFPPVDTSGQ